MKILGIAGSLRQKSFNKMLLLAAKKVSPELNIEIFDLDTIPPFNQDLELKPPEAVIKLKSKIREANAVLIATPEYNYSIPGVLKNAIDWASRPYEDSAWDGKVVGIMGATPGGFGTVRAQLHLRQCFIFLNITTLNSPELLVSKAEEKFDFSGNLIDEAIKLKLKNFLEALAELAKRQRT